jgi:hydroxymethylpyrimidine pyrophosphatase-like HAD family hydrolase
MNYKAILFDMDGTLVPMDNDVFTKGYFKELAKKLSPLGLAPDALIAGNYSVLPKLPQS